MNEFDVAYAEFDAMHPVLEEKNYENGESILFVQVVSLSRWQDRQFNSTSQL